MTDPNLSCKEERRREDVRAVPLFGLDYVEVSDNQLTLTVFFLGKAPAKGKIGKANILLKGGTRIKDVQVTALHVSRREDPTLDDYMEVEVNKPGDFSTYTLSVVKLDDKGRPTDQPLDKFDPRYDEVTFSFKAGCPTDLDCKTLPVCPPPVRVQPEINYLAKDYASFRQLILDRLALLIPAWQETHVPDLGIVLVELLAYAGDYLSYYQDAVATEAYLGAARERISVRRHARLVDYAMHEGCNSRAWVTVTLQTDTAQQQQFDPKQIYFITAFPGSPATHVLDSTDLETVSPSSYEVFEPLWWSSGEKISIYRAHNEPPSESDPIGGIHLYTWGDCQCCLPKGATSAMLVDKWVQGPPTTGGATTPSTPGTQPAGTPPGTSPAMPAKVPSPSPPKSDGPPGAVRALNLHRGDVLIFEEVIGPKTGNPADADPAHRQAVRLTKVAPAVDRLYHQADYPDYPQPIVEIEWALQDALTFPLCISAQAPPHPPVPGPEPCVCMENVSVARGNVILVDNGASGREDLGTVPTLSTTERCPTPCEPSEVEILPGVFRPTLQGAPLTFSQPIRRDGLRPRPRLTRSPRRRPCACPPGACSAAEMIVQDPRQALPSVWLQGIPPAPECAPGDTFPCQIPPLFPFTDLADPTGLAETLKQAADPNTQFLLGQLTAATREKLAKWDGSSPLPPDLGPALVADLTALLETWTPRRDLLESGPDDNNFVVEMDNNGYGHLRFGDGQVGRMPDADTAFEAHLRLGNGPSGNVGAETITYLVLRDEQLSGANILPRNPLPATGGTAPEPLAEVKLFAPYAFRDVLERAITADDYATLAADNDRRREERYAALTAASPSVDVCAKPFVALQGAKATLRWTGSWYEALVAIDPEGTEDASPALVQEIREYLEPYRRIGYDLTVAPAEYVPVDLGLTVCVLPKYLRAHVEAALLDVFSNRMLPDGTLGFFHPDNLTFGEGIYVSKIVAAAQALPGVQNAVVTRLERFEISEPPPWMGFRIKKRLVGFPVRRPLGLPIPGPPPPVSEGATEEVPTTGVLKLGPLEIARCDNDPNFPENGRLTLDMRGGR